MLCVNGQVPPHRFKNAPPSNREDRRRIAPPPIEDSSPAYAALKAVLVAVLEVLLKYASGRRPARASYPQPSDPPRDETV